jgi:transposase
MRGRVSRYRVKLNPKPRKRLETTVRRRSPQHWLVQRARIVLLSHRGWRICEICEALSVDHQVVRRWLKRYLKDGYDGLKDQRRAGRPAAIEAEVWQKVSTLVVQLPERFGLPLARWSVRSLARFVAEKYGWQVSRSSISRFLRAMAFKPHRVQYWLNPKDPDFDEKAARICKLYISPPARATVLSIDEKPGIQALRRLSPTRPLRANQPTRVEFEYQRKGTRNLFAAFNIKTGEVLVWVTPDRSQPYVLSFLDQLLRRHRRGPLILITDNINTRTGAAAKEWLAKHPRVRFVFTPKHGSWLNQIEIWFGILTRSALAHRSFGNVAHLARAIYAFARHWNGALAKPFEWTYTGKVLRA